MTFIGRIPPALHACETSRRFTWRGSCITLRSSKRDFGIRPNNQKEYSTIARRPHNAPPTRDTGPRVNDKVRAPEIRLIGADGENFGVVSPSEAMTHADEAGLDLVEISPNASPPVCKIMDFGKFKYEQQKKESEARKNQKVIDVKEIKFRPNTDTHD